MFSKLINTSVPSNFFIIPLVVLAGWWSFFLGINPVVWNNSKSIIFSQLPQEIFTYPFGGLINLITIIIISLTLIPFTTKYFHGTTGNVLPSIIFISFSSQIQWISSQGTSLIAMLLFIYIVRNLFEVYHQSRVFELVFNAGFLTGLSALIYFPSVLLLIFCWATIVLLRPFSFREFFTVLIGFLLPFIFTHAIFLLLNQEQSFLDFFNNVFALTYIKLSGIKEFSWWLFLGLFSFWGITKTLFSGSLKKIVIRRYFFSFLIAFILFAVLLLSPYSDMGLLSFLIIPLSFFVSISMASIRKHYYADFFIVLIIVIQVLLQIQGI
ncbi:MAG: hypothetical protein HY951_11070 [Bacteroidia bacterium]|nr:hypothetical protein [Bacteroidia bacterium]